MNSGHATVIKGKVYYGGGLTDEQLKGGVIADNLVHCYDPTLDSWSSLPPLKIKCFGLGQINQELVATGGVSKSFQDRQIRAEVYTFNEKLQQWRENVPPMIMARCFHGVMSLHTALIVAGGQISSLAESSSYTDSVEIFKHADRKWYRTNPLPVRLFNMSMTVLQDTCYIAGGFRNRPLRQVYYAALQDLLENLVPAEQIAESDGEEVKEKVWKSLPQTPCYQPSVIPLAGCIFAIGGSTEEPKRESQKDVYAYSPSYGSWQHLSDMPTAKRLCTAVSLSPLEVMVIGGRDINSDMSTVCLGSLQH